MYNEDKPFSDKTLWIPYMDHKLSRAVIDEVNKYYGESEENAYSTFSWSDEDNEDCPAIADYLAKRNIFQCFIDCSGITEEDSAWSQ